jgi:pantothenate kinase
VQPTFWERLTGSKLHLDQTDTPLEVDRIQIERFYHPLAKTLLSRCSSVPRLMLGVAGPPGSGKTAFATILVAVVNAEASDDLAVLVGLDGWHYSNEYLATHFIDRDGQRIALSSIKGVPETFDAAGAYSYLSEIRRGGHVSFPVYSRRLHEPVPRGGSVDSHHKIVVVEGNYLLMDEDSWRPIRGLFDIRMFISAPRDILIASLTERHQRGGKTPEATARQVRMVDLPNAERVGPSAAYAQVLVHKKDARTVDRIEWRANPKKYPSKGSSRGSQTPSERTDLL